MDVIIQEAIAKIGKGYDDLTEWLKEKNPAALTQLSLLENKLDEAALSGDTDRTRKAANALVQSYEFWKRAKRASI